ncbi:MAG: hypothetical protein ACXVUE_20625 [Solirubrobacteraceae bacterium]
MGPTRWLALVAFAATIGLTTAPAAGDRPGPLARTACARIAPGVCEESGNISLPPHSYGSQATDTVPNQSTEEDTFLTPLNTNELADFDSLWDTVADGDAQFSKIKNTTVRRLITCALVAKGISSYYALYKGGSIPRMEITAGNANAAILAVCVQVAVLGQQQATTQARDAAANGRCSVGLVSIPVQVVRSGSRYRITLTRSGTRARQRGPLAVSCRARSRGIQIRVRSRRRRGLRRAVGSHFSIGYSNGTSHSVGVRATFRFS